MTTSKSTRFDVRGINHLSLVTHDMEQTVAFYTDVLGMPLVKTLQMPNGGQQFFFEISDNSRISFFWFPDAPPAQPGITSQGWYNYDPATGKNSPPPGFTGMSAVGSMHHVAFDIPLEKQEEYKERLRAAGVPVTEVNHHILVGKDGKQVSHPSMVPPDAESIDEFVNSIYFPDPNGMMLEFAAWTRPLTPDDVVHVPARAVNRDEEAEARPVRRQKAATAGG